MKVCPVCSEAFTDEFKFCDLDGTRLIIEGQTADQPRNRLWSLLGIGVLFGALIIIALSVFLTPKTPVSSPTLGTSAVPPPVNAKPSIADALPVNEPEPAPEELPLATETKKKEKTSENANTSALNPKAAVQEDAEVPKPKVEERSEPSQPEIRTIEPPAAIKAASEKAEAATKTSTPTVDPKKDGKESTTKASDKQGAGNKDAANKEKKKGGFLNVFKKIFGKKDKENKQ